MSQKLLTAIAISLAFIVSDANAIEGVEKVTLNISGKEYLVPVGDMYRKNDLYYLKKYLDGGDTTSLEFFLGTEPFRVFYIGDDSPAWVKVSKSGVELIGE